MCPRRLASETLLAEQHSINLAVVADQPVSCIAELLDLTVTSYERVSIGRSIAQILLEQVTKRLQTTNGRLEVGT